MSLLRKTLKQNLLRSNLAVPIVLQLSDDEEGEWEADDYIYVGYRREDFFKVTTEPTKDNPEGLSDDIKWKLFLARQTALIAYKQKWG